MPTDDREFTAYFRYFGTLTELLKRGGQGAARTYRFREHPGVKDAVEAMGVPHTEVDILLANGRSVGFGYRLQNGDDISVYPPFSNVSVSPLQRLTPPPQQPVRFILDVHLGKLARRLRLLGLDSVYHNVMHDAEIMEVARAEERIILTCDRGILKHRKVMHGCLVRSNRVEGQVREVLRRFRLSGQIDPWTRCLNCNGRLEGVAKGAIEDRLKAKTRRYYEVFRRCTVCNNLYWQGSHFDRMKSWLTRLQRDTAPHA